MALDLTLEKVTQLLASSSQMRKAVFAVAQRLEKVGEYHPEQALIVAFDIVRTRFRRQGVSV